MRLSDYTGNYIDNGTVVDRVQRIADGGESFFSLTFDKGNEEVYVDGKRLLEGASLGYVAESDGIRLNTPLADGQKFLAIGRTSTGSIPFAASEIEKVELTDGQRVVELKVIGTAGTIYYVSGVNVDRGRLSSPADYTVTDDNTITLKATYPGGTLLSAVRGQQVAWPDPNDMVVDDGRTRRSLSDRFQDLKGSYQYFIEIEGTQLQDLQADLTIQKWTVQSGTPILDPQGNYPTLIFDSSAWTLEEGLTGNYVVSSWTRSRNTLTITTDRGDVSAFRRIGGASGQSVPDATDEEMSEGTLTSGRIASPKQIHDAIASKLTGDSLSESDIDSGDSTAKLITGENFKKGVERITKPWDTNPRPYLGKITDSPLEDDPYDTENNFDRKFVKRQGEFLLNEGTKASAMLLAPLPSSEDTYATTHLNHGGDIKVLLKSDTQVEIGLSNTGVSIDGSPVNIPVPISLCIKDNDLVIVSGGEERLRRISGAPWYLHVEGTRTDGISSLEVSFNYAPTVSLDANVEPGARYLKPFPFRPLSHIGDVDATGTSDLTVHWDIFEAKSDKTFPLTEPSQAVDVYVNWVIQDRAYSVVSDAQKMVTAVTIPDVEEGDDVSIRRYVPAPIVDVPTLPAGTAQHVKDGEGSVRTWTGATLKDAIEAFAGRPQLRVIGKVAESATETITLPGKANVVEVYVNGIHQRPDQFVANRTNNEIISVRLVGLIAGEFITITYRESMGGNPLDTPIYTNLSAL